MRVHIFGLALALAFGITEIGRAEKADTKTPVYKTPQAVFDAFAAALKKNDFKAVGGTLTRDSLDQLAGGMALGAALQLEVAKKIDKTGKATEKLKPLAEVLKTHGLTEAAIKKLMDKRPKDKPKEKKVGRQIMAAFAGLIKDKGTFMADYSKARKKMNPRGLKETQSNPLIKAKLENLKIDADKATARAIAGPNITHIEFLKEGGGWKMVILEGLSVVP